MYPHDQILNAEKHLMPHQLKLRGLVFAQVAKALLKFLRLSVLLGQDELLPLRNRFRKIRLEMLSIRKGDVHPAHRDSKAWPLQPVQPGKQLEQCRMRRMLPVRLSL